MDIHRRNHLVESSAVRRTRLPTGGLHNEAIFGGVAETGDELSDPDNEIPSIIPGGPGLVAVGRDAVGRDGDDAAVWVAYPED